MTLRSHTSVTGGVVPIWETENTGRSELGAEEINSFLDKLHLKVPTVHPGRDVWHLEMQRWMEKAWGWSRRAGSFLCGPLGAAVSRTQGPALSASNCTGHKQETVRSEAIVSVVFSFQIGFELLRRPR